MKPARTSYFTHQRKLSNNHTLQNPNVHHNNSPVTSSFSSTLLSSTKLHGIQINISSDPFQHRIPTYVQRYWQDSRLKQYWIFLRYKCQKQYQKVRPWHIGLFIISLITICVVLLLHVGFFSGKRYQDWKHDHKTNSNQIDLLESVYPSSGKGLTTLIIMVPSSLYSISALTNKNSWNNKGKKDDLFLNKNDVIVDILSSLCDYDIFKHIMIWDDDDQDLKNQINLSLEDLEISSGCSAEKMSLHKIKSDKKGIARYTACSMANTPYCYFQDIPHQNRHLRSLYSNFLQSSYLIHSESVDGLNYFNSQWSWCLWNEDHQIHTCHNTVGSGTFLTKELSSAFINLMELNLLDPIYADMYFSIWQNQPTYLLQGSSPSSPLLLPSNKKSTNTAPIQYRYSIELTNDEISHIQKAAVILYNNLHSQNGMFTETEDSPKIYTERNAKSPCYNDRCIFLTNIDSLPNMNLFDYHPEYDLHHFIRLHTDYNNGASFQQYAYSNAVDDQDSSCWLSNQNIQQGDYIGLDLLMPMPIILKYRILVDHPYSYTRAIQLQISYDGSAWIDLPLKMKCVPVIGSKKKRLLGCQFIISVTGYRFLRLNTLHDLDYKFAVYDFSVDARVRKGLNGQPLDIELENDIALIDE